MTISISHMTSFCEMLAEWWLPTTFTSCRPIPCATPKGSSRHREIGHSRTRNHSLWVEVGLPEESTSSNLGHVPIWCTSSLFPPLSKTFPMRMPNGKPELGSSWISLSKLVSQRESHSSMCGRTLNLGSRDKNSGPRAARMSQTTISHVATHPNLLACLTYILITPRHPVILDSFAALIHLTICTRVKN
jgi:hypothetical protein